MRRLSPSPKSSLGLAAGLLLVLLAAMPRASAQEAPPTAMFIVDGSGSMWGNLAAEKDSKLEMVREAMRTLLPSLRPEARVGLASFGHRRRGSCGDAEVILPPDANGKDRLATPVDRLNAVGKGPMVLALREAAGAIAGASPASIILIADDIDNCGQNVCTALKDILATSPKLVVHTVALGFDKAKIAHISCIARTTGGKLWDVQDGAGLASAIDQAAKLANLETGQDATIAAAPQSDKAPDQPAAGSPPGLYLSAGLGASSATLDTPVHWRIVRAGGDGALLRDTHAAVLYEKLEPGSYDVTASLGLAQAHQTVDVAADKATEVRLDLNGGVLKMQARPGPGAPLLTAPLFTVTPTAGDKGGAPVWVGRDAQPEIVLPAGEYVVSTEDGSARQESKVNIAAATGTTVNAVLAAGTLELSATRGTASAPGEPLTGGVTFILYQDDPDAPQGRREVARSAAPAPSFVLPAGTYYITARTGAAEVREQIAIGAGDAVKRALPLSMGHVKLATTLATQPEGAAAPITFRIVRLGPEAREVLRTVDKAPEVDLAAGRYRIEAALGSTNVRAATEINIAAGQGLKVTLPLEAGSVTLKRNESAPLAGDVFWEVRDTSQHVVLRTSQAQPTALLAPGRYVVSAETSAEPLRNSIEVKANEHRTFDMSVQ